MPGKYRPILHVNVRDETGAVVADIDGQSTADALAWYLSSRRIVPDATESIVKQGVEAGGQKYPGDRDAIVFEQRHPITGALERQLMAEVH